MKGLRRFLKGAAIVSLGGIVAKALGVAYKIPLANYLGGYGEGLYQMSYPLFCLMLTFSSVGIPTVVARAVAAECALGRSGRGVLRSALSLFAELGICGSALMAALALPVARMQGDLSLTGCYYALAPAVFPVALISVLRGYWQGRGVMTPTAASEIAEQLVKTCLGLLFVSRYADDAVAAARGALFAVTISEFAALFLLSMRPPERERFFCVRKQGGGVLFLSALPVMASAALLPLSQTLDSVLIVRLLSRYTSRAVSLYGLFAGSTLSLVQLPATLCSGLVAAAVPAISACCARGEEELGRERALTAVCVCLVLSLPCALALFFGAPLATKLLYPSLGASDAALLVKLLRLCSVSAVTLAAVDTLAACLVALGRAGYAAGSMAVAVLFKALMQGLLVGNASLGIVGAAIASNTCYLVAFFLDLFYTVKKKRVKQNDNGHRSRSASGRRDEARARRTLFGGSRPRAHGGASVDQRSDGSGNCI